MLRNSFELDDEPEEEPYPKGVFDLITVVLLVCAAAAMLEPLVVFAVKILWLHQNP